MSADLWLFGFAVSSVFASDGAFAECVEPWAVVGEFCRWYLPLISTIGSRHGHLPGVGPTWGLQWWGSAV